jgi:isochorismate hydrolase
MNHSNTPLENFAVLLIDMQKYFLEDVRNGEKEKLIESQIKLSNQCKEKDIPLVVLEFVEKEFDERETATIYCLNEFLQKVPRYVNLKKQTQDGFTNSRLEMQLREWNVNNLCLTGIYANACVMQTAFGALDRGFKIHTSKDLIADPKFIDRTKSEEWYSENGSLYKTHEELISAIAEINNSSRNYTKLLEKRRMDLFGEMQSI